MDKSENLLASLKYDIPAGLVVFLVALPLCLGIALASGAPVSSGIIAGVIGGLLVPMISKSALSVSGPAAGLTTIVLLGIETLGSFEVFLLAIFLGGLLQIGFGFLKFGNIAYFIPSSVIKGMMAGIGLILILKQFPHAVGYDVELFGFDQFIVSKDENTFTLLLHSLYNLEWGALVISVISVLIMVFWSRTTIGKIKWLPAALIVTVGGILLNQFFNIFIPELYLSGEHLVNIPKGEGTQFDLGLATPDWSQIYNPDVFKIALTIGVVASLESLLTVEAIDKIDPYKRKTPLNRELIAQGAGNCLAGLIGGIPITSVVVRSSASISAGGKNRGAAISHGIFLMLSIMFLVNYLNMIPLASLASVLLTVGYKLAAPSLLKKLISEGPTQLWPAVLTTLTILLTGLLTGILVGIVIGLFFVFKANYQSPLTIDEKDDETYIKFNKDIFFINKVVVLSALESVPRGRNVIIDGSNANFIDHDILELIKEFEIESLTNFIHVKIIDIPGLS
jgi:MFS superfamily sulfate permease-like transporter